MAEDRAGLDNQLESRQIPNPELFPQEVKKILDRGALSIFFCLPDSRKLRLLRSPEDTKYTEYIKNIEDLEGELDPCISSSRIHGGSTHITRNKIEHMAYNEFWMGYTHNENSKRTDLRHEGSFFGLLMAYKLSPLETTVRQRKTEITRKRILGIVPMSRQTEVVTERKEVIPATAGNYIDGLKVSDSALSQEPIVMLSAFLNTSMSDDLGRPWGDVSINFYLPESLYKKIENSLYNSPSLVLDYIKPLYPKWYKIYVEVDEERGGKRYKDVLKPAFKIGEYSNDGDVKKLADELAGRK